MEVTKQNFKEILPEVEEAIKSAEFVTIDGEFTGLSNGLITTPYDTPTQYYNKIRNGAMDFLLIQFGLCAFKYDKMTKKYTHQAYNFYIFPKPPHSSSPDTRFLCQSSSIDFLINNGFDFNKLFRDGIPYLNKKSHGEQEARLKIVQEQRAQSNSPSRGKILIPPELAGVVHDTCADIERFLFDNTTESNELECPRLNGFVRKLIYQEIYAKFPNENLILDTKILPDKTYVLVARKGQSKAQFEEERCQREQKELEDAIGFSSVISLLTKHSPCLVGHNMLLDLCHLVNRFCFDLPEDYVSFKSALHCIFPQIVDTKHLCAQSPLREIITNSALSPLLETVQKEPFTKIPCKAGLPGRGYSISNEKYHEAGYDAYITGLVFLSLSHYLQSHPPGGGGGGGETSPSLPLSPLPDQYRNKLHLMRLTHYPYVDLKGTEPTPDLSHVFVVNFPATWKSNNIADLFSSYGPVNISWISDKAAFVALHKKGEKNRVIKDLIRKKKNTGDLNQRTEYLVRTYAEYTEPKDKSTAPPSQHSKRKRTSSNNSDVTVNKKLPGGGPSSSTIQDVSSQNGKKKTSSQTKTEHTTPLSPTLSKQFEENTDWD
uniref:Poly(A)-specific ribonuclease PARN n=1 Tax=Cacopsylla melanoneura TaxID=428564 RepID=A0A8D8RCG3_9HEMI